MRYVILLVCGVLLLLMTVLMVDADARSRTICRGGNDGDWFSVVTGARSCVRTRVRRHRHYHDPDPHRRHDPRVYSYEHRRDGYRRDDYRREPLPRCRPMVTVKGAEASTETGAQTLVKRAWRAAVRADYGEVYQDLNWSEVPGERGVRGAELRCWRTSTNESVLGRGAETAGRVVGAITGGAFEPGAYRKRCQVWAVPCMPPRQRIEKDTEDGE